MYTYFFNPRCVRMLWPVTMLMLFLQRTPVLRVLVSSEFAVGLRAGQMLRAAFPALLGVAAVNTLTGATKFTTNPVSPATATVGTSFIMVCSVTGAPSASKSYTFSGLPPGLSVPNGTLSGSTWTVNASTGSISGTPTTAGNYTVSVRAWEKVGATGEKSPIYSYVINVGAGANAPPSFTTQPTSQTVTAGANVTFTVAASGSPTPTYQWRKGGANLTGKTSATLTLTGVTTGDAGSYDCVATNTANSATSNAATLTVNAGATAPAFTTQPTSQTVTTGANVTFTVAASGSPTPAYQWRKGGANLTGKTSATLSLTGVTTSDAGSYDCVATNAANSATSNAATLTVSTAATAPAFTTQPVAQDVSAGGTASFSVAVSGSPTPTMQWRKGGVNLVGKTGATLSVTNVTAGDAGDYDCVATNSAGSTASSAVSLTVAAAALPIISSQPVAMRSLAGSGAFFAVRVTGSGLSFQWQKNGSAIAGATQSSLSLTNVQPADTGAYTVSITDSSGGQVTSSPANLTVSSSGSSRLVNMSARAGVGAVSGALIPGFAIEGDVALTLLVRGVGPHLVNYGVTGVLNDPVMTLYQGSTVIASNDDWEQNTNLAALNAATAANGAFPLAPGSKDSAMLLTLNPGTYTVQVTGKDGATGEALVELYVVSP